MSDMSFEFWSIVNKVQELSVSVGWLRREVSEAKKIIAMLVDGEPNAKVLAVEYLGKMNAAEQSVHPTGSNVAQNDEVSPDDKPASNGNDKSVASG